MLESIMISDEEMAGLPEGIAGFLEYESLCRAKLNSVLSRADDTDETTDIRISYLTNVLNAAAHYGVSPLQEVVFEPDDDFDFAGARWLARKIDREVSRMRFVAMRERRPPLVIELPQRAKVEHLINQLRERLRESDFDERAKSKVSKKLDDLSAIFAGRSQPSLKDAMIVIASIFTAINQGQAAIIKLPETISAVLEVFGHAQSDADEKAIEAKVAHLRLEHHISQSSQTHSSEVDDIPF